MKKNKFKQKIKQISVVSLVGLALSPLLSSTSVVLADEVDHQNDSNYTTISVGDLLSQLGILALVQIFQLIKRTSLQI